MDRFLGFLTIGIIQGMIYGVIALGINLIYKGSRTLNLAQPFMGLFAAFVAWYLTGFGGIPGAEGTAIPGIDSGPWFIRWLRYPTGLFLFELGSLPRFAFAAVLSLLLIMRISYRFEHDIMRRLENSARLVRLVATIALSQGLLGLVLILFERTEEQSSQLKRLPILLPDSWSFSVGAVPVTSAHILILVTVPLLALATAAFFKYSKFGVAIRATAENREAAQLLGVSARRVASFTWIAAGGLAGLAALLIVPAQQSLDSGRLGIGILIRALAASLIGGLTSLPGAFAGGLIIGVMESVPKVWTTTSGVPEVIFFLLIIAVLAFRPGGLFGVREGVGEEAALVPQLRELPGRLRRHPVSGKFRRTSVAVGVMLVSAISLSTGSFTNGVLVEVLVFGIVGVSLTVLIGYAGQISLGHWAFVGVGAFAAGNLYDEGPVPFWLMIPCVVLIGMVVSLAIGLPALRIRGPYLAVVTLSFAIAASQWIFSTNFVARGSAGITVTAPDYGWLDLSSTSNRPMFFFALASFLLCVWVAHNFKGSRTGRGFFSLRENEKAAETFGVQLTRYRLLAFALSGGMAALGGVVFGLRAGTIAARDFGPLLSLLVVAMVIIGGLGSLPGAVLGAFLMFGAAPLLQSALGQASWVPFVVTFASGIALIVVIVWARGGLAGLLMLPRDPVVQGLVLSDGDAGASGPGRDGDGDGDGEVALDVPEDAPPSDETVEIERLERSSSKKRASGRSGSRSGSRRTR